MSKRIIQIQLEYNFGSQVFGQAWITDFIRGEHCLIMFILIHHLMKKNEEISEEIYKNFKIISSN